MQEGGGLENRTSVTCLAGITKAHICIPWKKSVLTEYSKLEKD